MCYDTTVCSTRVVHVGLCVRIFGRGFLPTYDSREVSTVTPSQHLKLYVCTNSTDSLLYIDGNYSTLKISEDYSVDKISSELFELFLD